jgi:NAD(P)-dependent dehydrogenase (short-subunit alcohol dehydrogenase family)
VLGLTRVLAAELGPHGIRVNALCPGMIETPMTSEYVNDPVVQRNLAGFVPLQRAGKPEDVAKVAQFLAGDGAAYITGAAIPVDGGFDASATWDPVGESAGYLKGAAAVPGS